MPLELLQEILGANADKSFVQRILKPGEYPFMQLADGRRATHMMASGEADGKYYAYPTIMLDDNNELVDYGESAWDEAFKRGQYIEFDRDEDAKWFSENYKQVWPEGMR